jgi:hypothetical protein
MVHTMKSRSGPSPFFIVGSPRSGTKLLRSILNAHSEVAIPKETFYFSQIVPQAKRYLKGHSISNKDGFLDVMRASLNHEPSIPLIMEDVLKREKSWTIGSLFSDVLTRYAHSLGKVRWGEKTPSHLWYWKTINNLFPGCKFIVMVRDGRDAVCSAAEMPWSTGNVFVDAFRWKIDIRKGYRLLSKLGPERAIQISY